MKNLKRPPRAEIQKNLLTILIIFRAYPRGVAYSLTAGDSFCPPEMRRELRLMAGAAAAAGDGG